MFSADASPQALARRGLLNDHVALVPALWRFRGDERGHHLAATRRHLFRNERDDPQRHHAGALWNIG